MRKRARSQLLVVLTTGASLASISPAAAAATFMGLGTLPTPYTLSSHATGVSGDGSVVVGWSGHEISSFETFSKPWRWTASGGMVGLDSASGESRAMAVSADGSTVIGDDPDAWSWTETGGMVELGFQNLHAPMGASSDGSAIAGAGVHIVQGFQVLHAVRWTSDNGAMNLGFLPGGHGSTAAGISGDGSVVVGTSDSIDLSGPFPVSTPEAFRWTGVGGMVGLGDLPGGASRSYADAVTADGSVVVGSSSSASGLEAFRWTSAGGMVGLGDLPGDSFSSSARAVSADGSVVVGYGDGLSTPGNREPFIWDTTNGMRSLTTVLIDLGLDLADWQLIEATAISADGLTIVGDGFNPSGVREAWIAVIPEPGTGLLLMTGLVGLAYRQRRDRRAANWTRS